MKISSLLIILILGIGCHSGEVKISNFELEDEVPSNEITTPEYEPPDLYPVFESGECSEGYYVRDANDCSTFYMCLSDGRRMKMSCGPYTYFDPVISGCNHKYLVKC